MQAVHSLGCSGAKYPLKAASYTTCSMDVESQNWADSLTARGFDPEVPTCWILEGLVMYLSPAAVEKLLKGMHAVSATGSRLLIMVCPNPLPWCLRLLSACANCSWLCLAVVKSLPLSML